MSRLLALLVFALSALPAIAQSREEKVRNDKTKVEKAGVWIYNDFAKAIAEAKDSKKPIVAVLRCLPCEECVKLDDDLIDADERIKPLLEKFVRVRLVSTNGLDLSLFQFDTDQSFCVFFLNADGTVYGRFGTRSHRKNWIGDVSVDGLAKAMSGALALHETYPQVKDSLAAKRGKAPEFAKPELLPSLKGKYTDALNYKGNVVQSCIHCHQIGDAVRELAFSRKEKLTDATLFPYPHPSTVGLTFDPKEMATVLKVDAKSAADAAGLKAGDRLLKLNGQPLLSIADVQWVLHDTPASGGEVKAEFVRGEKTGIVALKVADGWRRAGDIGWRSSTWGLRRKALGGMLAVDLPEEDRKKLNLSANKTALLVQHVGLYAPHDIANKAGVKKGDVIVGFDGRTDLTRETDLIVHSLTKMEPGQVLKLDLLRDGKPLAVKLTLP